jgi:nucleotide-binding universal stress UspA family protein
MDVSGLEETVASARAMFERIFVPVDYSKASHVAFGVSLELRRIHGSSICLFHALEATLPTELLGGISPQTIGDDWAAAGRARLERFLENVAPGAREGIELRARVGPLVSTARDEMHAWGATMLIAAANVHALFLRSPAERLVHNVDVPTLIIPASKS